MFRCPSCGSKINSKNLVVEKPTYKPRWWEFYYDSLSKYYCSRCGVQIKFKGRMLLVIAVFLELLFVSLIMNFFDIPRWFMAVIVISIFFILLKILIRVNTVES